MEDKKKIKSIPYKCNNCQKVTELHEEIYCYYCEGTNEWREFTEIGYNGGPIDLDFRQGLGTHNPFKDSALKAFHIPFYDRINICSYCGCPSNYWSKSNNNINSILQSNLFKAILSNISFPLKARIFLSSSLIYEKQGNFEIALINALRAAWVCEDSSDGSSSNSHSINCRLKAIELIGLLYLNKKEEINRNAYHLIRINCFRRIGDFLKAQQLCEKLKESGFLDYVAIPHNFETFINKVYVTNSYKNKDNSINKTIREKFEHPLTFSYNDVFEFQNFLISRKDSRRFLIECAVNLRQRHKLFNSNLDSKDLPITLREYNLKEYKQDNLKEQRSNAVDYDRLYFDAMSDGRFNYDDY